MIMPLPAPTLGKTPQAIRKTGGKTRNGAFQVPRHAVCDAMIVIEQVSRNETKANGAILDPRSCRESPVRRTGAARRGADGTDRFWPDPAGSALCHTPDRDGSV